MGNSPWECKNRKMDPGGGAVILHLLHMTLNRGFHTFFKPHSSPQEKPGSCWACKPPTKPHERGLLLMLAQHETVLVHTENITKAQAMSCRLGGTVLSMAD